MHGMRKSLICVFRSGSCRHQLTSDSVPRYGRPSRPSPRMDWTRPKKRHPSHHPSRSRDHQTSPSPDCEGIERTRSERDAAGSPRDSAPPHDPTSPYDAASCPDPPAAPAVADECCFLHEAAVGIGEAELSGRSAHHRDRSIGGRAEHEHGRDGRGRYKAVTHTKAVTHKISSLHFRSEQTSACAAARRHLPPFSTREIGNVLSVQIVTRAAGKFFANRNAALQRIFCDHSR
jgi:hypothetical protein